MASHGPSTICLPYMSHSPPRVNVSDHGTTLRASSGRSGGASMAGWSDLSAPDRPLGLHARHRGRPALPIDRSGFHARHRGRPALPIDHSGFMRDIGGGRRSPSTTQASCATRRARPPVGSSPGSCLRFVFGCIFGKCSGSTRWPLTVSSPPRAPPEARKLPPVSDGHEVHQLPCEGRSRSPAGGLPAPDGNGELRGTSRAQRVLIR
jgi:hypothetical protein